MKIVICGVCISATDFFKMITINNDILKDLCYLEGCSKECRISVRGETLYLTVLSAVTPTQ